MKKNWGFLILILIVFFSGSRNIYATKVEEEFTNYYFYRRGGEERDHSGELYNYSIDGNTTYCIEPGVKIEEDIEYVESSETPYDIALTEKIGKIGYYGYDYPGHKTLKYRIATQLLIWEAVGGQQNEAWTEAQGGGEKIDLTTERNEIMNLVNKHNDIPSFHQERKTTSVGQEIIFTDTKNILSEFEIASYNDANVYIKGNELHITPTKEGEGMVTIKRKSYTDKDTKYFFAVNSQKQAYFGTPVLVSSVVFYTAISGSVEITKVDEDNHKLSDTVFEVYNSDHSKVCTIKTDQNGYGKCEGLPYGKYTIKEVTPKEGYLKDEKIYEFELNENNKKASFTIKNEIIKGYIEILKVDADTLSSTTQGDASLKGAVYQIFNAKNELVDTLITDEFGYAKSKLLPYGKYTIKESKASPGYKLDKEKYKVSIEKDKEVIKITSKEEIRRYDFTLTKTMTDGKTGIVINEPNAEFDIYLKRTHELVGKLVTDEEGKATLNLPYGTYSICQTKGHKYSIYASCFDINIKTRKVDKTINNEPIKAYLKVIKIDAITKNNVSIKGIKFKIKDLDSNEYVCQKSAYSKEEKICEFQTNEEGILITPEGLPGGRYQLEEVDDKIDGYLWNKEVIVFEINREVEFTEDKDLGLLLEIKFANEPVKGEVTVTKVGEEVKLANNSYSYSEVLLDNVLFALYADDDIYSKDGQLIHKKGELIGQYLTKDGTFTVEDLYLGRYYFIEIKTLEGYVIDKEKHYFTLEYVDQYTPIVRINLTFKNYLEKGNLLFRKKDNLGNKLSNAKIALYSYTDNEDEAKLIYEGFTDEEGSIFLDNLFIGKYYLIETVSPDGYLLTNTKLYFEIKENDELVELELINEPVKTEDFTFEVPNTFQNNDLLSYLLILTLVIGYIYYGKKKKN